MPRGNVTLYFQQNFVISIAVFIFVSCIYTRSSLLNIIIRLDKHKYKFKPPSMHHSSYLWLELIIWCLSPLQVSLHSSLLLSMICQILPIVSLLVSPLCHSSILCLPDIMSSHYLHSSCRTSPSIYPLSLPLAPPRLSPLDRATYYLYQPLHPSFLWHFLAHTLEFRCTFTVLTSPVSRQTIPAVSNLLKLYNLYKGRQSYVS